MQIMTKDGKPVTLLANCGDHRVPGHDQAQQIVEVQPGSNGERRFCNVRQLTATGGNLAAAIEAAEYRMLTDAFVSRLNLG